MKIVLQVVKNASVIIEEKLYSSIGKGYLLLVSFKEGDNEEIAEKMAQKIVKLRVFLDEKSTVVPDNIYYVSVKVDVFGKDK